MKGFKYAAYPTMALGAYTMADKVSTMTWKDVNEYVQKNRLSIMAVGTPLGVSLVIGGELSNTVTLKIAGALILIPVVMASFKWAQQSVLSLYDNAKRVWGEVEKDVSDTFTMVETQISDTFRPIQDALTASADAYSHTFASVENAFESVATTITQIPSEIQSVFGGVVVGGGSLPSVPSLF